MPYIGFSPGMGTRDRFIYTATASQTTFSGADDNGKTLRYDSGDFVDVYLNGILLVPVTDYTATSLTSIVLTQAASADDTLEVLSLQAVTVADTVSKSQGGTFEGEVNTLSTLTVGNDTQPRIAGQTSDFGIGTIGGEFKDSGITLQRFQSSNTSGPSLLFGKSRGANIGDMDIVQDGDELGKIRFYGSDGTNMNSYGAEIEAFVDGTPGSGDMPGRLIFGTTADGASATTERMRINSDGQIGVGTSSPGATMHVYGANNTTAFKVNCGPSARYEFAGNSTSGYGMLFDVNDTNMSIGTTSTSRPLHFGLGSNDVVKFNSSGSIYFSTTDYTGSLASSDDGKKGVALFGASGGGYFARDVNATGAECLIVNNIHSTGASSGILQYRTRNTVEGSLNGTSSGLAITNASDYRKKENVADATGCLTKITGLRPVTYTHRSAYDTDTSTVHTGFIAHEVADHIPSIVDGVKDAVQTWQEGEDLPDGVSVGDNKLDENNNTIPLMQSVAYADQEMIANLVGAIKELKADNDALRTRIEALEAN